MPESEFDQELDLILATLPEHHEGEQQRQFSLTRRDGEVVASMIRLSSKHQGCAIGLNIRQAEAIRNTPATNLTAINDIVKERKKLLQALGVMTLGVLGFIGQMLFTKIDWAKIWKFITVN